MSLGELRNLLLMYYTIFGGGFFILDNGPQVHTFPVR